MSKTDKIYIALLLLIAAGGIGTREYQSHKIDAFNPDGHYLDSILKEKGWPKESIIHLPITSDTATPETKAFYDSSVRAQEAVDSAAKSPWNMDSIRNYLAVYHECDHLDDSLKDVYILYAQGKRKWEDVQRAKRIYKKYFFNVYKPCRARLEANSK